MTGQYVLLVRHGETAGNREKCYVGSTDEGLTAEAVRMLETTGRARLRKLMPLLCAGRGNNIGKIQRIYLSPMRRCRETAAILFPGIKGTVVDDFREMNFGRFEYKNYSELNGNPAYQAYIDSGGESAFPGGESKAEFCERVVRAAEPVIFRKAEYTGQSLPEGSMRKTAGGTADNAENELTVIVAHGGTIMAIMDRFSSPHEDYFSWHVSPGGMLLLKRNERSLEVVER